MVSVLRESNISQDLNAMLGTDATLLHYSIQREVDDNVLKSGYSFYNNVGLRLTFYVDQKSVADINFISATIEDNLATFNQKVNASFISRSKNVEFNGNITLHYALVMPTYEGFEEQLRRAAQLRMDKEFTKALEAKLSED